MEQGEAQGMGGLTRVQDQTTSLEQVEESREVAKDLHLDQEREVLKDQGPPQENQEVEQVVSKVEEVASKVEAAESKEEVVEKQLPALERNCRFISFLMRRQADGGYWLNQNVQACIDVCPGFNARVFGACVAGCAKRCTK